MPDVFDAHSIENEPALGVALVNLLAEMRHVGLVANLNKDRWSRFVFNEQLPALSPKLRDAIITYLNLLKDRKRLVRHPKRMSQPPQYHSEWLDIALQSHREYPFHGILMGDSLLSSCATREACYVDLADAFLSTTWQQQLHSVRVRQREVDYRKVLTPLLRYASSLHLVDPFLRFSDPKSFKVVKICSELLGKRGDEQKAGYIHLHVKELGSGTSKEFLDEWQHHLTRLPKHPHTFKIFVWRDIDGLLHDRFIFTDQCGVAAGNSFRADAHSVVTTVWNLLDYEVWTKELEKYNVDENTKSQSPFRLIDTREIPPS